MKKLLSTILAIFIVFSLFFAPNLLFAQGAGKSSDVGVNLTGDCLMGVGQNCFHYEKMLGIENAQPGSGYTVTSIAQDVILSATYMVGTVLTVVIIICGFLYILSSASGKGDGSKYKSYLVDAAIGAILVWGAYAIVRLIQYIARG